MRRGSGGYIPDALALAGKSYHKLSDNTFHIACPKFLPDEYYIAQIKHLADTMSDKKLYVFLFTDNPNPPLLVTQFTRAVGRINVTIHSNCSKKTIHLDSILNDFFSLIKYDCLIRSESNFSLMAELLGNHKMVLSPLFESPIALPSKLIGAHVQQRSGEKDIFNIGVTTK